MKDLASAQMLESSLDYGEADSKGPSAEETRHGIALPATTRQPRQPISLSTAPRQQVKARPSTQAALRSPQQQLIFTPAMPGFSMTDSYWTE